MDIEEKKYYKKINELNDRINDCYCRYRLMCQTHHSDLFKYLDGARKDLRRKWAVKNERITKQWNVFFVVCKVIPQ
jgi:hypothetical protein